METTTITQADRAACLEWLTRQSGCDIDDDAMVAFGGTAHPDDDWEIRIVQR